MCTHSDLSVDTCVTIRETCPMEYTICGNLVEFHFGGSWEGFHFAFDAAALRKLAKLSKEAVAHLDALPAKARAADVGELICAGRRSV